MFVLSREPGSSIYVGLSGETCVVTCLGIDASQNAATVLINRTSDEVPGRSDVRTMRLVTNSALRIAADTKLKLLDIHHERARFMVDAPRGTKLHRLEVYEAMRDVGAE